MAYLNRPMLTERQFKSAAATPFAPIDIVGVFLVFSARGIAILPQKTWMWRSNGMRCITMIFFKIMVSNSRNYTTMVSPETPMPWITTLHTLLENGSKWVLDTYICKNWNKISDNAFSVMLNLQTNFRLINTLRPRQNNHQFADNVFKCIYLYANVWILIAIFLKFVSKGPNDNTLPLVQIMTTRRPGDKPLLEAMTVR